MPIRSGNWWNFLPSWLTAIIGHSGTHCACLEAISDKLTRCSKQNQSPIVNCFMVSLCRKLVVDDRSERFVVFKGKIHYSKRNAFGRAMLWQIGQCFLRCQHFGVNHCFTTTANLSLYLSFWEECKDHQTHHKSLNFNLGQESASCFQ